jgi:co-chaperonin GroES (HSP10)
MSLPKITGLKACGSQILVELLNEDEMLNTSLIIPKAKQADGKMDTPQAYIIAMGPKVIESDWGFKVGDRVMFSTTQFVAAPNYNKHSRDRGCLEPMAIRAVLVEGENCE